jgi:hypothetical protein
MLGLKLVRLIEQHSEDLAHGLVHQLRESERTCDFRRIPTEDLHLAAVELYRHLEDWLVHKKEQDIERRMRRIAARRASQRVRLPQLVWALVISRNHLLHFLRSERFVDDIIEVLGELEVQHALSQFFDQATYYSIVGYEDALGQKVDRKHETDQNGNEKCLTPTSKSGIWDEFA